MENKKPTHLYATISTTIVLVLLALFLLIFFHSSNISDLAKENINLLVELEDNLPSGQIDKIKSFLTNQPGIKNGSVAFISKDKASELMNTDVGLSQSEENPFKDIIKFNLLSEAYNEKNILDIKKIIELEKGVIGLYYEKDSIDLIKNNLERFSLIILILAICFVVLALAIIYNTIRLTLYADFRIIKTMQMVGADRQFIKKPYMRTAFDITIKSMVAVIVLVVGLTSYLKISSELFAQMIQWKYVALTIIFCFLAALFIQMFTTNRILDQYLKNDIT